MARDELLSQAKNILCLEFDPQISKPRNPFFPAPQYWDTKKFSHVLSFWTTCWPGRVSHPSSSVMLPPYPPPIHLSACTSPNTAGAAPVLLLQEAALVSPLQTLHSELAIARESATITCVLQRLKCWQGVRESYIVGKKNTQKKASCML